MKVCKEICHAKANVKVLANYKLSVVISLPLFNKTVQLWKTVLLPLAKSYA